MADLLVSSVIPAVLEKSADSLVQQIGKMLGVNDQQERLHELLLEVQAVLPDAEVRANSNTAVKSWLEKIKLTAYDADDLFDELYYEKLRRYAVRHGHKVGKVSGFPPLVLRTKFRNKMNRKLNKVLHSIRGLVIQMETFKFVQGPCEQVANRTRTESLLVEPSVVGRDEDKEKIVKVLLEGCNSVDLMVVPIVGMGGLGKTTLAQLVFNDPSVKEHFKLPLWVCVSEEYNIGHLVKSVIELIIGKCNVSIDNMELLRRFLHQAISGKRYLLVLDDVWNDNITFTEWERLRAMLNYGDSGSAIIVTTRSDTVASIMGTEKNHNHNLGFLGEDDSWNLFHTRAFGNGVMESRELVEIGKKMVQNCGGLPLAINALGSLMSNKHEVREWSAVLEESKSWEIRSDNNNVLQVLKLSYDHLPLYMKQCFAFCAVFPKGYEMDKEKLIQYWMASGFIPSDGSGSPEIKGNDIFKELAWRSFYQNVKQVSPTTTMKNWRGMEDGHLSETKCKMHDLMHDLAQSIMGAECLSILNVTTTLDQPKVAVHHISIENIPSDINTILNCFPSIRSLILSCPRYVDNYIHNIEFLKKNSLRILDLTVNNHLKRTMVAPKKMKYLRYLELTCNETSLPEALSTLYLLQTLRLIGCWELLTLPDGMRYMSSLRHLHIELCDSLVSMPSGLGLLKCLKILTIYIIGTDPDKSIGELKNLDLHGKLQLYNLSKVRDAAIAREANLIAKKNLEELALCWGKPSMLAPFNDIEVMHCNPDNVFEALKPCNNLKILQVVKYPGNEFPVWMSEHSKLENLVELYITDCSKCKKLPPIEKLPFLQILYLKICNKLKHICNIGSTSVQSDEDTRVTFPSLKRMELYKMPDLSSWCEGEVGNETSLVLPMLKGLDIFDCPKLIAMPNVPLLEELSVKGSKNLSCFATRLTTLQRLSLESHGGDSESENQSLSLQPWECLNELYLSRYNSIVPRGANDGAEASVTLTKCQDLNLTSCNFIFSDVVPNPSLWFWNCFTFLEKLFIIHCDSFIYWPQEEFKSLNCLKFIFVGHCQNFLGSWHESQSERSLSETLLPKLEHLSVRSCPNIVSIPKCSPSLQNLGINDCKKLQCLPEWLGSMVSLKELQIKKCENLEYLPEGMEKLKALEKLNIQECPKLRDIPEGLLQQLKNVDDLWIHGCPHLEIKLKKDERYKCLISD